jgi:hypothetical protein
MSVLRSRWALIQPGWSPSARQWASCAVDECAVNENTSGRALYIFGGFGVAPGNDLSKFSLVDRLWTRVPLVGESREQDPVPARYYHASAVVDGYLYIFGGASASDGKPLDDFYKISLGARLASVRARGRVRSRLRPLTAVSRARVCDLNVQQAAP